MDSNLETRILDLLRGPHYQPKNKSEIARTLEIPPDLRSELRDCLRRLEEDGTLVKLKHGRFSLRNSSAAKGNILVGTLRIRQNGDAFFLPDLSDPQNREAAQAVTEHTRILLTRGTLATALPGDRVAVAVAQSSIPKWWKHVARKRDLIRQLEQSGEIRWTGRVVKVLERARNRFVGTFHAEGKFLYVTPDEPEIPTIEISSLPLPPNPSPHPGQKVLANITSWESRQSHPRGEIVRILGDPGAPGIDVLSIVHRYGLPTEFPLPVLEEAESRAAIGVPESELASREDWREKRVITIDPEDAKDFDDAIAVEALPDGGWELAVHIADVSFYVKSGSALDQEALSRGNSTYLVDRVIPMLPEPLSNGICSLRPNEDRLTRSVIMRFDKDGHRTSARFAKSVIRSHQRLSYEQAFALMRSKAVPGSDPVTLLLHRAWALASKLRSLRFAKGSLDLDFPEIKVILDQKGHPIELRTILYDESHQLIEECMLAANEAVAQELRKRSDPAIYRIHDDPDEEKLYDFRDLARQFGHQAGDLTHRPELQKLLAAIKGSPEEHTLKLGLLKSMKRAVYHADPLGHYGLAKADYTHFTSPIRRYADLVVHRVLFKEPDDPATPRYARMGEIAEHVSDTERTSAAAELDSVLLKKLEYIAHLTRTNPNQSFHALIHDVRRIGLFVEIPSLQLKGLVKADDLPGGDDYEFDRALQAFVGLYHGRRFALGQPLQVLLKEINRERNLIDFRAL